MQKTQETQETQKPENNEGLSEQAAMIDDILSGSPTKTAQGPYGEANEPFYGKEESEEEVEDEDEDESDEEDEEIGEEEDDVEEEEDDEGESDLASMKRTQDMLLQRLDQLAEQTGQSRQDVLAHVQGEGQQEQQGHITPLEDILTQEDLEEAYRDPKTLNNAFRKIYERAVQDASQAAMQRQMPALQQYVGNQIQLRQKAEEFYGRNPELAKHKQFVGHLAQKVAQENPSMSIDQLYSETEKRAKSELGINKKGGTKSKNKAKNKAPKGKGGNKPGRGNKQQLNEFEELL